MKVERFVLFNSSIKFIGIHSTDILAQIFIYRDTNTDMMAHCCLLYQKTRNDWTALY